jgi:hypothetical protein
MEIEFVVKSFDFETPVTLQHPLRRAQYLSTAGEYTSEPVKWMFKQEGTSVFVRSGYKYLGALNANGCPNSSTHKFPWTIVSVTGDNIILTYAGIKTDLPNIHIVVSATDSNLRWTTAYEGILTVGTGISVWLNYIVANYQSLPDRVFFLNGKHKPDTLALTEDIVPLGPVIKIIRDCSTSLDNYVNEPAVRTMQTAYRKQYGIKNITVTEHFLSRMGLPAGPTTMPYAPEIAATRAAIQRRPLAEYRRLLEASISPIDSAVIERLWLYLFSAAV